jgi:hypothetical protein
VTKKHDDELGDEQLDKVAAGGLIPGRVEYPNLTVAAKGSGPGTPEPKPGFMDYTDDSCMD